MATHSDARTPWTSVCVIGAGASGVAAARGLSRAGVAFDWFDRNDSVGGMCVRSDGVRIGVSRARLAFSDWPMARSLPQFPRPGDLATYLRHYAERFELDRRLRLATTVRSVRPLAGSRWSVTLDPDDDRVYDAVVVASGYRSGRRVPAPTPPGDFAGVQLGGRADREDPQLRGRDVVVVGDGATAFDTAVESSYVARSTTLSILRPRYVLPDVLLGRPYDQLPGLRRLLRGSRWLAGSHDLHGLPTPRRGLPSARPIAAPHLLERLLHGRISVRPAVARLEREHVVLADGKRVPADTIVWCSGRRTELPFLPPELDPLRDGNPDLLLDVFHPSVPRLAFAGLVDPVAGALTRIAERQGRLIAAAAVGRGRLRRARVR